MKIAICGASGFIGSYLCHYLKNSGYEILPLRRKHFKPKQENELLSILEQADIVINLAGSTIAQRWTRWAKEDIIESRIGTTRLLAHAIDRISSKPKAYLSASAVGIYPNDYHIYRERDNSKGKTFLAETCKMWEEEASTISKDVRLVIMRFGLVFGPDGGALSKMIIPFKLFMGGIIGNGYQLMSWIHIEDLANAIKHLIESECSEGVYNISSPEVLNNRSFTRAISKHLKRPSWLRIPRPLLRALFGDMSIVFTQGQGAYPERLINEGFIFKYDSIEKALKDIL
ncbi:MAG: TIGR01777 family oxidoreductase [Bacteroidales bacterium]